MKNPGVVINAIRRATKALPELRVGQLIANAVGHHHQLLGVKSTSEGFADPFYVEDEDLAKILDQYVTYVTGRQ